MMPQKVFGIPSHKAQVWERNRHSDQLGGVPAAVPLMLGEGDAVRST